MSLACEFQRVRPHNLDILDWVGMIVGFASLRHRQSLPHLLWLPLALTEQVVLTYTMALALSTIAAGVLAVVLLFVILNVSGGVAADGGKQSKPSSSPSI